MTNHDPPHINLAELTRLVRATQPRALLLPPRTVQRVVKQDRQVPGLSMLVPHRRSYLIDRERLLTLVAREDLGPPELDLPRTVLLIARPDEEKLARTARAHVLTTQWRILFHAAVHLVLEQRIADGKLTEAEIQARVRRIGQTEFEEVREVLHQEEYLFAQADDCSVYTEFAAVYLELKHFAPMRLGGFFPGIVSFDEIDDLLATDLDAAELLAATRLPGTPDLDPAAWQMPGADGENVGALPRGKAAVAQTATIDQLTRRLSEPLALTAREREQWRMGLVPLFPAAASGFRSVEGRLLFYLHKVCIDAERPLYAADLVGWALSLGRKPVKRSLPRLRAVLLLRHLRSALARVKWCRLAEPARRQLNDLLQEAVHRGEDRLRTEFRPILRDALGIVGLTPRDLPDQVSQHRLIEELLDGVCENGFLSMGNLRDAVASSSLKLADVAGPGEAFVGDRLLAANERLAEDLDGVYRKGEFYLRWLQTLSSLAFGTRPGRFFTRYLALPFGGAYIILKGCQELAHEVMHFAGVGFGHGVQAAASVQTAATVPSALAAAAGNVSHPTAVQSLAAVEALLAAREIAHEAESIHLVSFASVTVLGTLLLSLLYIADFRSEVLRGLRWMYGLFRWALVQVPRQIAAWPLVRWLLDSPPVEFFRRHLRKPVIAGVVAAFGVWLAGSGPVAMATGAGLAFLATAWLLHTRLGRDLEQAAVTFSVRNWKRVRFDLLPGLLRIVMGFFSWCGMQLDRLFCTIDEWLRVRGREGPRTVATKALIGLVWAPLAYAIRMLLIVFIEPQFNPIKHFPVVTVAHKVMLGMVAPVLTQAFTHAMGMAPAEAILLAGTICTLTPGMFGFLVWELKENWKLYRANQAGELRPAVIGHHGETVELFLKPGFHAGTIPKTFARLRRAERHAHRTGDGRAAHRQREALHHVEESLRRFLERDFIQLLNSSRRWGGPPLRVGHIQLATNRIRIEVCSAALGEEAVVLELAERSGWLVAAIARPGWLGRLEARQRQAFRDALGGLWKLAGVDLVREQLDARLQPLGLEAGFTESGLLVGPPDGSTAAATTYDLRTGQMIDEPTAGDGRPAVLSPLLIEQLYFEDIPVRWSQWVEVWQAGERNEKPAEPLLEGVELLPARLGG